MKPQKCGAELLAGLLCEPTTCIGLLEEAFCAPSGSLALCNQQTCEECHHQRKEVEGNDEQQAANACVAIRAVSPGGELWLL